MEHSYGIHHTIDEGSVFGQDHHQRAHGAQESIPEEFKNLAAAQNRAEDAMWKKYRDLGAAKWIHFLRGIPNIELYNPTLLLRALELRKDRDTSIKDKLAKAGAHKKMYGIELYRYIKIVDAIYEKMKVKALDKEVKK